MSTARSVIPAALAILDELFDPSIRLYVEINYDPENAGENYRRITAKLDSLYG